MLKEILIFEKIFNVKLFPSKKYYTQQIELTFSKKNLNASMQMIYPIPCLGISTQLDNGIGLPQIQLCKVIKFSLLFLHYTLDLQFILVFRNY